MQAHSSALETLPRAYAERTVIAAMVQFFLSFAVKYGLDPDELCDLAGTSPDRLAYGDLHVPYGWLATIRQAIIDRLPDVAVGIELGRFSSVEQFGYLGQAIKYAGSPLSMLQVLTACAPLADSLARVIPSRVIVGADRVRLESPTQRLDPPECVEGVFVGSVATIRSLSDRRIAPLAVQFSRPRQALAGKFQEFFDCEVTFGHDVDTLVFDRVTVETPFSDGDRTIGQRFLAQWERRLNAAGDPFTTAVRSAIEALLGSGLISQERIARRLGLSARSLQRRLKERELSYQQLVADVRKLSAKRLLEHPAHSILDVATALDYDVSSFNRVFRRWTGMSPSAYRKTQRTENDA